jgi:hypothetical protein
MRFPKTPTQLHDKQVVMKTDTTYILPRQYVSYPVLCHCSCHEISRISSPRWLGLVFGSLHGSISRFSRPLCSSKCCRAPTYFTASLLFFYPSWMLHRSIYVNISNRPVLNRHSVQVWVTTSKVLHRDHPSLYCVSIGDVRGLSVIFQTGGGSPTDYDMNGDSLLHVCIEIPKPLFLLKSRVDCYSRRSYRDV